MRPQAIILAGPNGAGKSTVAPYILPPSATFINADDIARDLKLEQGYADRTATDIAAGRLLLKRLAALEQDNASFAIETNLANRMLAARIPKWQAMGYRVTLIYLWVTSPELAIARVAERVRKGGHHIPEEVIRRRYKAGLQSFFSVYSPLVNTWSLFENRQNEGPFLLATGMQTTHDLSTWKQIRQIVETAGSDE